MFQTKFVENIKTPMLCYVMLCYVMLCYVILCYVMLCSVILLFESRVVYENVEKYYRVRQNTDDYTAHAYCALDS